MPEVFAAGDPLSFYSAAAGVIPVIVLALAFQFGGAGFRFIPDHVLPPEADPVRRARRDAWIAFYTLVMLGVLVAGEAVSLFVVAAGAPQPWWAATVAASLVIGAAGLVIPICIAQVNSIAGGRETGRVIRNGMAVAVRALLAVVAGASLIGGGYAVLAPSRVKAPNVVGTPSAFEAERLLQQAKLELAPVIQEQVINSSPPGTVVEQTPAAGTSLTKGASVTIAVGVTSSATTTPDVVGETLARAERELRAAGLSLGTISPAASAGARVRSQTPAAGERVRAGTAVNLLVAR